MRALEFDASTCTAITVQLYVCHVCANSTHPRHIREPFLFLSPTLLILASPGRPHPQNPADEEGVLVGLFGGVVGALATLSGISGAQFCTVARSHHSWTHTVARCSSCARGPSLVAVAFSHERLAQCTNGDGSLHQATVYQLPAPANSAPFTPAAPQQQCPDCTHLATGIADALDFCSRNGTEDAEQFIHRLTLKVWREETSRLFFCQMKTALEGAARRRGRARSVVPSPDRAPCACCVLPAPTAFCRSLLNCFSFR